MSVRLRRNVMMLFLAAMGFPLLLGLSCPAAEGDGDAAALDETSQEDQTYAAPEADPAIDGTVVAASIADGQDGPLDVMRTKLDQAIQTLLTPQPEQLHMAAIDEGQEARYLSNLTVLRTAGVPETDNMSLMREEMTGQWIGALTAHIDNPDLGTPATKEYAYEVRNFEQVMAETLAVIELQTSQCPPDATGVNCPLLVADDEGALQLDNVLPTLFYREVRRPFWYGIPANLSNSIQEQVILPGVLSVGDCSPVLKEIQGIKAVVSKRLIPIWVEPWYARATIVGYRVVWVWEFVPAEFLKTITYCNMGNGVVTQKIDIRIVLERQLMHFWAFMRKDITEVGG